MKKVEIFLLVILVVTASILRLPLVLQGFFAFTHDQGRDLLEVEKIIYQKDLRFIGPTTGLPGIFYGPWWYYILVPVFLISGGDPLGMTTVFSILGITTVIACYLLLKNLTKNILIAFAISLSVAMSQIFITYSSQIWSPVLVIPLMIIYIISVSKLLNKISIKWFLMLGISSGLIFDSEVAFGLMLIGSTVLSIFLLRKKLLVKKALYFFLPIILLASPRIIFDLKNNFLISKSVISWLLHPAVYQQKLGLLERALARAQQFNHNFAQTFTQSNDTVSLVAIIFIVLIAYKVKSKLVKSSLFVFLSLVLFFTYLGFTLFPDAVWDYYLVGLPPLVLVILVLIFKQALSKFPKATVLALVVLNITNFNKQLFSPIALAWEGDGAVYKNQKNVLDYTKDYMQGDYSLYFYTPSRFDYPFDYLVSWYIKKGLIATPKENQKDLILIIRDDAPHLYLPTGWYGDKTKDKTNIIEKKKFPGDIILERHLRHD